MAGQKKLQIAKTKYFDIIYSPASIKTASILFEKADGVYEELAEKFQLLHTFRLPLVLSPGQDEFNAYYSSAPFNHIVIYDTVPPENFSVFSESVVNTFRHELIHAITYNLHNTGWYRFEKIFGDTYNPALITITQGFAEGATVSVESDAGEGRLNDDFHKQLVRQAKIEGAFPKYSEIQGSLDTYPNGYLSYYFGGAFNDYLQKKYGFEKYAEFWYKCVNWQTLTYWTCFKKVYGIKIQDAWDDFYASIEVPPIPKNPTDEKWCENAIPEKNGDEALLSSQTNYDFLSATSDTIVFYDNFSSTVRLLDLNAKKRKTKKLLTQSGVTHLNVSHDKNFVAISYQSKNHRTIKNKVRLVNLKNHEYYTIKDSSIRDAAVFQNYAVAVQTVSQNCFLNVYALEKKKNGNIKNATLIKQKKFEAGDAIYSPSGSDDKKIFYIKKKSGRYSIECFEIEGEKEWTIELPESESEKIVIRNLAIDFSTNARNDTASDFLTNARNDNGTTLTFSYTQKGTMPRFGMVNVDFEKGEAVFSLSKKDSSGGVFFPALVQENKFAYIAQFFSSKKVLMADLNEMQKDFATISSTLSTTATSSFNATATNFNDAAPPSTQRLDENSAAFNPFTYFFSSMSHGTILPVSVTRSYSIKNSADEMKSMWLPFGLTYVSSSPWTYPIVYFSAGYGIGSNSGGAEVGVYGGTRDTPLFKYSGKAKVEFDSSGFKQFFGDINLSSKIEVSNRLYLQIAEKAQFFAGRQTLYSYPHDLSNYFKSLQNGDDTERFFQSNETSLGFGNIKKSGKRYYDYSGFLISAFYKEFYSSRLTEPKKEYLSHQNIGLAILGKIPFFLPITLQAELFPSDTFFLDGKVGLVLWTKEIQKSTNRVPLFYANRFTLSTSYLAKFAHPTVKEKYIGSYNGYNVYGAYKNYALPSWAIKNTFDYFRYLGEGDFEYFDEIELTAALSLCLNFGGLASQNFKFDLSASLYFRPNPEPDENHFSLGICGIVAF